MTTGNHKEPLTERPLMQEGGTTPRPQRNQLLRQSRQERRWSQAELAECVKVSNETISRWENGASKPQPQQLRKLCEVFEKPPEALGYPLEQVSIREETSSPPPPRRRWSRMIVSSSLVVVVLMLGVIGRFVFPSWQSCGGAFSDAFHGSLDSRWNWVNPGGNATYSTAQGFLSLSAPPDSDIYPKYHNFSAPRLLQHISGDFTLSTLISSFSPNTNYQSTGILLWQDRTTFLRVEIAFGLSGERGVDLQQNDDSEFSTVSSLKRHPTTAGSIELSIQKQDDHFTAWWRVPGQNWQSVGETDLHFDSSKLMAGLDLIADYSAPQTTASYSYFKVSCT